MPNIPSLDLTRMQAAQADSMFDTCTIIDYDLATDAYGDLNPSPTVLASGISCGISFQSPAGDARSEEDGWLEFEYDAILRVPLNVDVPLTAEVTILTKNGKSINDIFKVVEFPEFGPSAQNVKLKRKSN